GEKTNIEVVRTLCTIVDECFATQSTLRVAFPQAPGALGKRARDLIVHVRDRPGHDRRYAIDWSKAAREVGYRPARDLEAGLKATVAWYLANTRWWQTLLGRDYAEWLAKNYGR